MKGNYEDRKNFAEDNIRVYAAHEIIDPGNTTGRLYHQGEEIKVVYPGTSLSSQTLTIQLENDINNQDGVIIHAELPVTPELSTKELIKSREDLSDLEPEEDG